MLGHLVGVDAAHETPRSPTGYAVSVREPSLLVDQGEGHYVIRVRDDD